MKGGEILEVGTHNGLLLKPNGAYSSLVQAQKFREKNIDGEHNSDEEDEGKSDFGSLNGKDGDEKVSGGLMTRSEAEKAAKEELPAGAELERRATGKSIASEIIEQKRKRDVEMGITDASKNHGLWYLFYRLGKLNKAEKWNYNAGFVTGVLLGMLYPVFG